ncbi:MAG: septum formation family protein [Mycobacteriales bacterium]
MEDVTGQGAAEPVDPWAPPAGEAAPRPPWAQPGGAQAWPASWPQPGGSGPWAPQTWPSYGWGPAPRSTNRWAVAALVTGILGLVPVALGAGITALVQVRRRGQAGWGMAIAGLVLAGLWTVVIALAVAAVVLGSDSGGALGRVADAGSTSVGSCLQSPTGDGSVSTLVDCTESHDGEVYFVQDLGPTGWPGYSEVDKRADDACLGAFEDYVGTSYDSSDDDYGYFAPDEGEWASGEHRVVCVVLTPDPVHESVRDSGR